MAHFHHDQRLVLAESHNIFNFSIIAQPPVQDGVPPPDLAAPRVGHPVLAPLDRVPLRSKAAVELLGLAHDGVLVAVVVLREVQLAGTDGSEEGRASTEVLLSALGFSDYSQGTRGDDEEKDY